VHSFLPDTMHKNSFYTVLIGLVILSLNLELSAQTLTPADVTLNLFYSGLSNPVGITNCGDHRLFLQEQAQGDIEIIDTNGVYIGTFLDLTSVISTGGERGLLGLAFHPDYFDNGFFFVNYTNTAGNTVIARYHVSEDPNVADPASGTILLTITQPYSNHNGGSVAFGPDGYLYIGMGDGGSQGDPENRAQNPLQLLGKMLRIDVDNGLPYTIPPSNPFYGQTDTLPEIWAFGLRNPWKFSFDRGTGDLWIGDVGQNTREEIDYEPAYSPGAMNYGWRCYEGLQNYSTAGCQPLAFYDEPVGTYGHGSPENFCSVTGGFVYRGQDHPSLDGIYFFSDYCNGDIYSIRQTSPGVFQSELLYPFTQQFVSFGEDVVGELYVVSITGNVYKLADTCPFYPTVSGNESGDLQCTTGTQYWWYKDGVIVPGENSQDFTPTGPGSYYAHVNNGSCIRKTNTINWLVVSGIGGCTYGNATNYSSIAQVDDGSCSFNPTCTCPQDLNADGLVSVVDLMMMIGFFGTNCNN
jgi:glucose/arabinose dehydrogenase